MNNKNLKMVYALKDSEIVHISEVERGLECGCICPACGEKLIARKGRKMAHHFAHRSGSSCEYGYESSLHIAAKQILLEAKKFVIPPVWIKFDYKPQICLSKAQEIPVTKVELEKKFSDVIPDVVIYSGNKKIFVEIFVTHAIDEIKLEKLKKARASTIEIDLSQYDGEISTEALKSILFNDSPNKIWKYNDKAETYYQRFCNVADRMETVFRGFAQQVDYCPISKRTWRGKPYANFIDDCLDCQYNIKINSDGSFLCSGRQRISTLEDFKTSSFERIAKKQEEEERNKLDLVLKGICPNCGGALHERTGPFGIFGGCENYPHCRFTVSINSKTGELLMK